MNIKKTMWVLLYALLNKILRFFIINAIRATLILSAYILRWSISLFEFALLAIDWVANKIDVRILSECKDTDETNTPLFTDGQIEVMALRLPKDRNTIDSIANFYSISARQARKIKHILDNKIAINNYQTTQ